MIERLQTILKEAEEAILNASDLKAVDDARVKYLGKSGVLTEVLKGLNQISAEMRPRVGKASNDVKNRISELLEKKKEEVEDRSGSPVLSGWDPTLPGREISWGKTHPLTSVQKEISEIFKELGFDVAEGPDVESDYYNFLALNFSPDHPARDAQDTFYVKNEILMRTHTSPIQVRIMEKDKPPFKFIAPGRVYRNEAIDATHHHIFHQIEGFLVDEGINFSNLKGILDIFIKKFFGDSMRRNAMSRSFSWDISAACYDALYRKALSA